MTEKRFKHSEFQQDDGQYQYYGIEDTEKNYVYNVIGDGVYDVSEESLINILNELNDENKQLKLQYSELEITLMNNQLAYNDLNDENTHIKNIIKEMYNNERTELGKSTLKQLLEAIQ